MDRGTYIYPWELILQTMACLLPGNPQAFIPPSHPASKVLFVFSRVCRSTRQVALPKLRQHCLYIDSRKRLFRFLDSLMASRSYITNTDSIFTGIHSLYLEETGFDIVDTLSMALGIEELFRFTGHSLKRLVMNTPFGRTGMNRGAPNVIEGALRHLKDLEELSCAVEVLSFMNTSSKPSGWPTLRRLSCWGPHHFQRVYSCIRTSPELEIILSSRRAGRFPPVERIKPNETLSGPKAPLTGGFLVPRRGMIYAHHFLVGNHPVQELSFEFFKCLPLEEETGLQ
ncbi:hypothetical protein F5Y16DRAFT_276961 [Xylariaceae sp. FL0255]|nr:hypothetical protein F5Y16DRAFT_276961 [Xylariaceae sp. FL0255]